MTKQEIIDKVKELKLPKGSYVVFGSCPMATAGIREAGDIDFLVTKELFEQFRQAGWQEVDKGSKDKPLARDVYEAHFSWAFSPYNPTLKHLLASADWIDGVPFAALEEVRKWKAASDGPKHIADVKLIDQYLANKHIKYHKDGSVWAKGQMLDGQMEGYWEWFRIDGTIMRSGHFKGSKQVGEWVTYDKKGQPYKITTFDK